MATFEARTTGKEHTRIRYGLSALAGGTAKNLSFNTQLVATGRLRGAVVAQSRSRIDNPFTPDPTIGHDDPEFHARVRDSHQEHQHVLFPPAATALAPKTATYLGKGVAVARPEVNPMVINTKE